MNKLTNLKDVLEVESTTDQSSLVEEGGENLMQGCGNLLQITSSNAAVYTDDETRQEIEADNNTDQTAKEKVCLCSYVPRL